VTDGESESTVQLFDQRIAEVIEGDACKSAAEYERVYFISQMQQLKFLAHDTADRLPEMQGEIVALLRELVDGLSEPSTRSEPSVR